MTFNEIIEGFKVKELPESEVEIIGEIPFETVRGYSDKALVAIAAEMQLPGFRMGHVPTATALQKVGETAVLEEALEICLRDLYPQLAVAKKIDAVGRPDIRINKLTLDKPVTVTVRTAVYPRISLPDDWRAISKAVPISKVAEVTEKDVTETLEVLRKQVPHTHEGHETENCSEHLPEIDDSFAKSLGAFRDLAHLKEEITKGIAEGKAREVKDIRRSAIVEALLEKVQMEVPRIFVESELEKIISRLKDDASRAGASFEGYLKHVKKTEDELRAEFREQAVKRAKMQLLLNKLANDEHIEPSEEDVEREMTEALKSFPDANHEALRVHIETVLRNDKVLEKLEKGE